MTTIEGNKLIAEFMGAKHTNSAGWEFGIFGSIYSNCGCRLKFDSSWDWLMPVVKKISEWCFENKEKYNQYFWGEVKRNDFLIFRAEDIIDLWKQVVEFIQWYNQNK